jgi:hypothetical protein
MTDDDHKPRLTHQLATEHAEHFPRIPDYPEWSATVNVIAAANDAALPPEARA